MRKRKGRDPAAYLDIQSDRAHELDAIALGDHAGPQFEIEFELAIHQLVLKVHILDGARLESGNIRQRKIMRADQTDRTLLDQCPNEALRPDSPVRGIGDHAAAWWARTIGAAA